MTTALKPIASIDAYTELQKWLNDYCHIAGHESWHCYGPADYSKYESSAVKVMVIGSESMGFGDKGSPPDEYLKWISARYATPRNTAVLVSLIKQFSEVRPTDASYPVIQKSDVSKLYQDEPLLLSRMVETIYMNARISSNNTGGTKEEGRAVDIDIKEFAEFRKHYIRISAPDIIICAGRKAKSALFIEGGAFMPSQSPTSLVSVVDGCVVVTVAHLSRPSLFGGYVGLVKVAQDTAEAFIKRKKK
jgi:hypothetical protein